MNQIEIIANGKPLTVPAGTTLGQLATEFNLPPKGILVEHNGTALHRSEWPEKIVTANDQIEFIRMVAGG